MAKIFVSHSEKDNPLVSKLNRLLCFGIGITYTAANLFSSSEKGVGVEAGKGFVEYIRKQVNEAEVVLVVLTPNYLDSQFCLCEFGAAWAGSKNILLLKTDEVSFGSLTEVISQLSIKKIDDKYDLTTIKTDMIKFLGSAADPAVPEQWEIEKDAFLKGIKRVINSLPKPGTVSELEHKEMVKKYDLATNSISGLNETIEKLQAENAELKELKDREKVAEIDRKYSNHWEQFDSACEKVKEKMRDLPNVVMEAAFQELNGTGNAPDEYQMEAVNSAVQRRFLSISEGVFLNREDPKVERLLNAIVEVESFLTALYKDEYQEFVTSFIDKHDYRPEFNSRDLWEDFLGLSSSEWSC